MDHLNQRLEIDYLFYNKEKCCLNLNFKYYIKKETAFKCSDLQGNFIHSVCQTLKSDSFAANVNPRISTKYF